MAYLVHDCETTIKQSYKRKANPFDPDNWVVANGWLKQGGQTVTEYHGREKGAQRLPLDDPEITLLVGFNYKFDLLWHWHLEYLHDFFRRGGRIWCCQYAEYLLEGQQQHAQMCSMDDIVQKYGGELKIDEVKALWAMGVDTPDIPEDLLLKYLGGEEGDLRNTEKIFLGQIKRARELGMLQCIWERMDSLLATTDMEYNGLCIDLEKGLAQAKELETRLAGINQELEQHLPELPPELEFNWGSRYHLSYMLFGGDAKYRKKMPILDEYGQLTYTKKQAKYYVAYQNAKEVLVPEQRILDMLNSESQDERDRANAFLASPALDRFKSGKNAGQPKLRNVDIQGDLKEKYEDLYYKFPGVTKANPAWETATPGVYSTSSSIIEILGKRDIPFTKLLAERAKVDKDLGTYYIRYDPKKKCNVGMLTLVNENDGRIHHKLNHCITVTTRLSSSDPNGQNLSRGDKSQVKSLFISRFGDAGDMIECDYSQLEVVIQGVLSGIPYDMTNLMRDLLAKVDFHCKRLSAKLKEPYDQVLLKCKDEEHPDHAEYKVGRTKCKEFSFQRAYGAGATAIAEATGMDVDEVKELIAAEEELYPEITAFNESVEKAVKESRRPTGMHLDVPGKPGLTVQAGRGEWFAPTGTRYIWTEQIAPEFMQNRGSMTSFSPPELKNYPVQGTGGEVVLTMLGRVWRHFNATRNFDGKAFLVNTVHDCIWADAHKDVSRDVALKIKEIMERVPEVFNQLYPNMRVRVPFPAEAEIGPNMLSMKGVH